MSNKLMLFEVQRAGDDILKTLKAQSKNFTAERFDVRIFGPDDVRFEKAFKSDRSLANDLKGVCGKVYQMYVAEMGKFLSDQAAKREKLKGEELKKFDDKFSSPLYTASTAAFKKLEVSVGTETKKRWKETVANNPKELAGVRFEPILIDFLASFDPVKDTAAAEEKDEPDVPAGKMGEQLVISQQAVNRAARSLKDSIDDTAKLPEQLQVIEQTVARVKEAYEKAPRESRKDDPKTEGSEELDEGELNRTIYNRYINDIAAAENAAIKIKGNLAGGNGGLDPRCTSAVKDLNEAIKKLGPVVDGKKGEASAALEKSMDGLTDAVKKILSIQSDARVGARSAKDSWMVWKTIREKKGAALDVIDEALVEVKPIKDRLVAVVQLFEKSRVGPNL